MVGFAGVGTPIYTGSMIADAIDADELKTNMRREGIYSGAFTFCMKLSVALGTMMTALGLQLVNYVPGETQSARTILFMRLLYAFPAITTGLATLYALRYPLVKERMFEIRAALDARKALGSTK